MTRPAPCTSLIHSAYIKLYLGALLFIHSYATSAWDALTDAIDLHCQQSAFSKLNCHYRTLNASTVHAITATLDGNELFILDEANIDSVTAILLLVDTSDPKRQNVINKNIKQIEKLVAAGGPHRLLGLGIFDKQLQMQAPVGASNTEILAASKKLQAHGMTTELYRNLLEAIKVLSGLDADKKAIFIFSDGQAEDKAYFHQDVVAAARSARVIINSLGYPRSAALSVALQNLRRLSDETGGEFIESNQAFELPSSFLNAPYKNIDTGKKFVIDLESIDASRILKPEISLRFQAHENETTIQIPLAIPLTKPVANQNTEATNTPQQTITGTVYSPPPGLPLWLWYGVPIMLAILTSLILTILFLLYRRADGKSANPASTTEKFRPYAYLVTQDEKGLRYPIIHTVWRIGRSRDNEMTLNDNSISRRHAEIQRDNNGHFILLDTSSANGLFVNNEKIRQHTLQEGDIIEIGDISLRFTQRPADYRLNEETAMLNTKVPT